MADRARHASTQPDRRTGVASSSFRRAVVHVYERPMIFNVKAGSDFAVTTNHYHCCSKHPNWKGGVGPVGYPDTDTGGNGGNGSTHRPPHGGSGSGANGGTGGNGGTDDRPGGDDASISSEHDSHDHHHGSDSDDEDHDSDGSVTDKDDDALLPAGDTITEHVVHADVSAVEGAKGFKDASRAGVEAATVRLSSSPPSYSSTNIGHDDSDARNEMTFKDRDSKRRRWQYLARGPKHEVDLDDETN